MSQFKSQGNKLLRRKSEFNYSEFATLALSLFLLYFKKETEADLWLNSLIRPIDSFLLAESCKECDFAFYPVWQQKVLIYGATNMAVPILTQILFLVVLSYAKDKQFNSC